MAENYPGGARKQPAYKINVRLPPPKSRFGWFGDFFYRVYENRHLNIARLYGLAGLSGIVLAGLGAKKLYDDYQYESARSEKYEVARATGTLTKAQIEEQEKVDADSIQKYKIVNPDGKPDYACVGEGSYHPQIRVSERENVVQSTIRVPIFGNLTVCVPWDTVELDENGKLVFDADGFPKFIRQDEKTEELLKFLNKLKSPSGWWELWRSRGQNK